VVEPLEHLHRISCQRACWEIPHYHRLEQRSLCRSEMTDHLTPATAQIAGFFVASVLYGVYLYTFFQCLYALLRARSGWKGYSDMRWGPLVVTAALFFNGTLNISLGLLRLIQQFSLHMDSVAWVNTVKVV